MHQQTLGFTCPVISRFLSLSFWCRTLLFPVKTISSLPCLLNGFCQLVTKRRKKEKSKRNGNARARQSQSQCANFLLVCRRSCLPCTDILIVTLASLWNSNNHRPLYFYFDYYHHRWYDDKTCWLLTMASVRAHWPLPVRSSVRVLNLNFFSFLDIFKVLSKAIKQNTRVTSCQFLLLFFFSSVHLLLSTSLCLSLNQLCCFLLSNVCISHLSITTTTFFRLFLTCVFLFLGTSCAAAAAANTHADITHLCLLAQACTSTL